MEYTPDRKKKSSQVCPGAGREAVLHEHEVAALGVLQGRGKRREVGTWWAVAELVQDGMDARGDRMGWMPLPPPPPRSGSRAF